MSKTAKRSVGLSLLALVVCVLAWRLWPDGGQARRQQRNTDLVRAVAANLLHDATRLLDEGADPNAQLPPLSLTEKIGVYYFLVSHGMKTPGWRRMDEMNPRWSALEFAVTRGNADMVSLLLSRGAEVGYRDKAGKKALDWAEMRKGTMPPAAWKASSYSRIVAMLQAAEARRKPLPSRRGE